MIRGRSRWVMVATIMLVVACAGLAGIGWRDSRADPVVRVAHVALDGWPAGASPVHALLVSDIHIGNASTDAARLKRVVAQIAALHPDIILIAGDFVAGYDPADARRESPLLRALGSLHPRLGIVAVLGNHDNWTDPAAITRVLRAMGVAVVENSAIRRGPLLIGGVGDTVSGHARLGGTLNALRRLEARAPGARLYLSHSPDIARWLPRSALLLAGHTHCGQVVLPWIGPLVPEPRVGDDIDWCGDTVHDVHRVIVSAGIGTSDLPIRIGTRPDIWLIELGPPAAAPVQQ